MTDMVNGKGPRDVLVGLIGKAMSTGMRGVGSTKDKEYFRGRVTAFVLGASMLADQMYGVDQADARHRIMQEVKRVREDWPAEDLRDPGKVGNEATRIASVALLEG